MPGKESDLHQSQGKRKKRRLKASRIILLALLLVCISIAVVGCGYLTGAIVTLPEWDPTKLAGSESTVIYDKDNKPASKVYAEENRTPVSLSELPPYLPNAFISVEDNRFYKHLGVDLEAIGRAVVANIKRGVGAEGGSTITQQLVKHAFLSSEKTFKRKIQEAILAVEVERRYSKDEILEFYLNRIYFGNGAYGVQTASQMYFAKDAKDLTLAESAMLAGIVRSPNNYNPFISPELAVKRQNLVLDQMVKYEKISDSEALEAKSEKLNYHEGDVQSAYEYPYFTDHVITEAEKILEQQGISKETSQNLVYRGGLQIYTSLNPRVQKKMEDVFTNNANFPSDQNGKQVQGAMVLLNQRTGEIQGLVGGRKYAQQRTFNRATQAKRQPGSAIKPIVVYTPAIEKGFSTGTILDDALAVFGKTTFHNYNDRYRGLIPMRTAVQWSINTYAVKLLDRISPDYGYDYAKRLGVTSLDPNRDRNLSLALGGITYGISPLEMAGAYGAIANQGVYIQPHAVRKIVDGNGDVLFEAHPQKRVVMSERTAYIMTDLLRTVVREGTGQNAQLNRPVAGKTGTTEYNVDIWFMGYTPEFTGAVWMGFDKEERMRGIGVAGGGFPALVWKAVMQEAIRGVPEHNFPEPRGLVRKTICSKSGLLPNAFCPTENLINELFVQGTVPTQTCDLHVQAEICPESGKLATPYCSNRIMAVFLKRPPSSGNVEDLREALPAESCPLHGTGGSSSEQKIRVKICTDPRHNAAGYLANTPGLLETGGCPPEFVETKEFPVNEAPKLYCPLPEHQVQKTELNLQRLFNQGKQNGNAQ